MGILNIVRGLIQMKTARNKLEELRFEILQETVDNILSSHDNTTTLDVKMELRKRFSDLTWNQRWVSNMMQALTLVNSKLDWKDNGSYKLYHMQKPKMAEKSASNKKVRISKTKAVEKIENSKGRFGSFTWVKKDNSERTLVGRYHSTNKLGYLRMVEISTGKIRNLNPRTLKSMRLDGQMYATNK